MTENTKLLRIESVVDRVLAWVIGLPAPVSSILVAVFSAVCVAVGAFL